MPEERTFEARAALSGNSSLLSKVNKAIATLALVYRSRVGPFAGEGNFATRRSRKHAIAFPARLASQTQGPEHWRALLWS